MGVWRAGGAVGGELACVRGGGWGRGEEEVAGGFTTTGPYGRNFPRGSETTTRDQPTFKRRRADQPASSLVARPLIKEGSNVADSRTDAAVSLGGVAGLGRTGETAAPARGQDCESGAGRRPWAADFGRQVSDPQCSVAGGVS